MKAAFPFLPIPALLPVTSGWVEAKGLKRRISGGIRSLVAAATSSTLLCVVGTSRAAPGSLDPTFNGTGIVTADFGSSNDQAVGVALQDDGKIIVVGHFSNIGNIDFAVARYDTEGTPDTTFNGSGKATTPLGPGSDHATCVAVQADGKIVVAGYSSNGTDDDFAVARYLANGTLDTDFNFTGKVLTPVGTERDRAFCVVVQNDGKIVVAGHTASGGGGNHKFALVRYNGDGTLDTDFNFTGKVITAVGVDFDEIYSMVLQDDGKIVVAGIFSTGLNTDFAVARYNVDGSLDTTFNGSGKVTAAIGPGSDAALGVALQSDGKILAAGYTAGNGNFDFALLRLNANGTLDTGFNGTGKVITNLNGLALFQGSQDYGRSVAVQADGKILVAGNFSAPGSFADFAVVRYNTNGSLDATFNKNGIVTIPIGIGEDNLNAMAVQDDGKIVLAGHTATGGNSDFALVRLNTAQGDARVGSKPSATRGDNIYNLSAAGQVQRAAARRGGGVVTVYAGIQNDGPVPGSFKVRGTRGKRLFPIKYLRGGTNVTGRVILGTYDTGPLAAGATHLLSVRITAATPFRRKKGSASIFASSPVDPTALDRVRTIFKSK